MPQYPMALVACRIEDCQIILYLDSRLVTAADAAAAQAAAEPFVFRQFPPGHGFICHLVDALDPTALVPETGDAATWTLTPPGAFEPLDLIPHRPAAASAAGPGKE